MIPFWLRQNRFARFKRGAGLVTKKAQGRIPHHHSLHDFPDTFDTVSEAFMQKPVSVICCPHLSSLENLYLLPPLVSPLRCQLFRGINNDQGSPCPRHQHSAEKMKVFYSRCLVSTYCVLGSMAAPMGEVWLDQLWPVVGKGSLGWCILDYLSKDVNYSCLE